MGCVSVSVQPVGEPVLPKKTTVVLQLLMTFMMATVMSGIMGFVNAGPAFLSHWALSVLIAWPIAFLVTQVVTPIAFKLAFMIAPPLRA